MPRTMQYLQRIGRLFTHSVESWQIFYIQIQPKNTDTWETLEESDYFRLKPYGYRTRLHQLLIHSQDEKGFWQGQVRGYQREQELAFWVARRYTKLHPDGPDVGKVRIVCAFYNIQDGKSIKGRWVNQPLESYSRHQKIVVSTHDIK